MKNEALVAGFNAI